MRIYEDGIEAISFIFPPFDQKKHLDTRYLYKYTRIYIYI